MILKPRTTRQSTSSLLIALALLVAGSASAQVVGLVRDATTLAPLAGATITAQATTDRVVSAADGTFTLPLSAASSVVVVAAHKGYFNTGVSVAVPASGVEILLPPVPQDDDPSYPLMAPNDCGLCHPDQYSQWQGSPMAEAGANSWVSDIYDGSGTAGGLGGFVYTRDSVFAADNPASECASCHQPEPWLASPFLALLPRTSTDPGVAHGVSCEVCHKIADVDETKMNFPGFYPGVAVFTRPSGPGYAQVQYGLLGDATFHITGAMRASYQPQLAAAACGLCHQDKNDPDEDGNFEEASGVISEPTYLEWLASPYADPQSPQHATCVDCHMPATGATEACTILNPPLVRPPGSVRSHDIRGTTPQFLENAATLALSSQVVGDQLQVEVTVTNDQTGHHLPTGVTVRNMILVVEARRAQGLAPLALLAGPTVHALGGTGDPSLGNYAGLPGRLYAKVNHNASGQGPTFFTEATGITFDSRLPALASDASSYTFALPTAGGDIEVHARLIYRRAWRALVLAKGWMYDGHDQPLADVAAPHYGHLMEEASAVHGLPPQPESFRRGDANGDGNFDIADAIFVLNHLFANPTGTPLPCADAADSNDSGMIDIADPVYAVSAQFIPGALLPPPPGPLTCGVDPTADGIGCGFYAGSICP